LKQTEHDPEMRDELLKTSLCETLGIEHPVIQGPMGGPWDVGPELVAAVSKAGGLGSVATSLRIAEQVRAEIRLVRELVDDRPFAVNLTRRPFDDEVFETTLGERPAVVSLALGTPADLVERAHAVGCVFVEQVTTVTQAREAAEAGVDVIIAQGGEGGGFSGSIGTLALVPQVVDVVAPIPVVAAGGISDGRGLAAALALGARVSTSARVSSLRSSAGSPRAGSRPSSRPNRRMLSRSSSRSTSLLL
jgi:enoyl-[acyl-carrier protein] reductase II